MKKYFVQFLILMIVVLILPYTITMLFARNQKKDYKSLQNILILEDIDGEKNELTIEEYLEGVVLSNIPVNYEKEAVKAAAVVFRTCIYDRLMQLTEENYELNSVAGLKKSDDVVFTTEQLELSYVSIKQAEKVLTNELAEEYPVLVNEAVAETENEILEKVPEQILPLGVNDLAKAGKQYDKILNYYFPGTPVVNIEAQD